jgi:hypothetical protein
MLKFPVDAPKEQVIKADGTRTPLTMPDHRRIKGAMLRTILRQSQVGCDEFLEVYNKL